MSHKHPQVKSTIFTTKTTFRLKGFNQNWTLDVEVTSLQSFDFSSKMLNFDIQRILGLKFSLEYTNPQLVGHRCYYLLWATMKSLQGRAISWTIATITLPKTLIDVSKSSILWQFASKFVKRTGIETKDSWPLQITGSSVSFAELRLLTFELTSKLAMAEKRRTDWSSILWI